MDNKLKPVIRTEEQIKKDILKKMKDLFAEELKD